MLEVLLDHLFLFQCPLICIIFDCLQTAKGAKVYNAAVAATGDGHQFGREGDDKQKMHTHSYCCLDYAQVFGSLYYHKR